MALLRKTQAAQPASIGSPYYMSPEQLKGEPLTHHSDMFCLGVAFYELLTGHKPFTADSLTVDQDLSVFGMGRFAWGMTHAPLNCVVPISNLSVQLDPVRSKEMFKLIREDHTSAIGKNLCTQSGLPHGG